MCVCVCVCERVKSLVREMDKGSAADKGADRARAGHRPLPAPQWSKRRPASAWTTGTLKRKAPARAKPPTSQGRRVLAAVEAPSATSGVMVREASAGGARYGKRGACPGAAGMASTGRLCPLENGRTRVSVTSCTGWR